MQVSGDQIPRSFLCECRVARRSHGDGDDLGQVDRYRHGDAVCTLAESKSGVQTVVVMTTPTGLPWSR